MSEKGASWTPNQRAAFEKRMGASAGKDTPPLDFRGKDARKTHERKARVTQEMVAAIVDLLSLPLSLFLPQYALTELEGDALVVAITNLAAVNQFVSNIIYNLVTVNQAAELPIVAGAILVDKLVVANRIPAMAGVPAQMMLASVASRRSKKRVETGGARSVDRTDGQRQEQPGEGTAETTGLRDNHNNEAGPVVMAGPLDAGEPGGAN